MLGARALARAVRCATAAAAVRRSAAPLWPASARTATAVPMASARARAAVSATQPCRGAHTSAPARSSSSVGEQRPRPSASDLGFDYTNVFAGSPLNRLANHRRDSAWIESRAADPNALYMVMWKLHPIVTTSSSSAAGTGNAMGTGPVSVLIRWFTRDELGYVLGRPGAPTCFANPVAPPASAGPANRLFLGVDERPESPLYGRPLFAVDATTFAAPPTTAGTVDTADTAAVAASSVPPRGLVLPALSATAPATGAGTATSTAGPMRFTDVRSAVSTCSSDDVSILAAARSLLHWHDTHAFCSGCGSRTVLRDGGYTRECTATALAAAHSSGTAVATAATAARAGPKQCPSPQHFPRTDPVTIMLLHDAHNTHVLLHRQRHFAPGVYSAVAGFMEPGESIEAGVRRESYEEVGVRVGSVRYHSSQPWPFPHTLMIGCFGEVDAADPAVRDFKTPLSRVDAHEVEHARWFTRDELRRMVDASLASAATPTVLPPNHNATTRTATAAAAAYRVPPPLGIAHVLARVWLDTTKPRAA